MPKKDIIEHVPRPIPSEHEGWMKNCITSNERRKINTIMVAKKLFHTKGKITVKKLDNICEIVMECLLLADIRWDIFHLHPINKNKKRYTSL